MGREEATMGPQETWRRSFVGPGESGMRPSEAWIGPQEAHHWQGLDEPFGSSIGIPGGLIGALGSLNRALWPWGSDEASRGLDWNLGGPDGVSGDPDRAWKYKDWASRGLGKAWMRPLRPS